MDLTLECIRHHYTGEPGSPVADVTNAYVDLFARFDGFKEFVDFFHLQVLVTGDYAKVEFYLRLEDLQRSGTPTTTEEHVTYREKMLEFIEKRRGRMAKLVMEYRPAIEVRQ